MSTATAFPWARLQAAAGDVGMTGPRGPFVTRAEVCDKNSPHPIAAGPSRNSVAVSGGLKRGVAVDEIPWTTLL